MAAIVVTTISGFLWYTNGFFGFHSLGEWLRGPVLFAARLRARHHPPDGAVRLLATAPFDQFMLRLKVGADRGIVLACPIWLYQVWAFITPGLYRKERRFAMAFVGVRALFFVDRRGAGLRRAGEGAGFPVTIASDLQFTALSAASTSGS